MKLIYKGKFDGNPKSLPHNAHKPNAVKFKEIDDPKKLSLLANIIASILAIILFIILFLRVEINIFEDSVKIMIGCLLSMLALFPHEILHAICFKEEVYLYTYFSKGMLFVTGKETMSKSRFIFMSLLPNIIFGFIPYIISMINPSLITLGIFGAMSITCGAGDYYNVFNAITQMPKGSRTYMYEFNSYWYMP